MLSLLDTGTLGDLGFFFGFGQAKRKAYGEGVENVASGLGGIGLGIAIEHSMGIRAGWLILVPRHPRVS
jgi:hypothetical protein